MSLVKSLSEALSPFFKPEVRKQGEDFIKKNLVVISVGSDTLIEGYVKGSLSARVSFRAESIEDENFYVDCNCSSSSKGQFCKHIWAMLLLIENKHPDFLSSKSNIERKL